MPGYRELVEKYKKRRHDGVVDAVTSGLSFADNVSADLGLLDDLGVLGDTVETLGSVIPFAVIALTEQCRVLFGKKTGVAGASDAAYRVLKTGAAMGAGAAVTAIGAGACVALPTAVAVRLMLDRFRSRALTGYRVSMRTLRLRALTEARMKADTSKAEIKPE